MTSNKLVLPKRAPRLAHKVYSAEQVRSIEPLAAKEAGLSMFELMQRAGAAVFESAREYWPSSRNWLVLAGHGNNGGDAYIAAGLAMAADIQVTLCAADPNRQLSGDALTAQQQWLAQKGLVQAWHGLDFSQFDLIIDGLLGTGLNKPITPPFEQIIQQINMSKVPVLSIDLPSGLEANAGVPLNEAVQADKTLTFVGIKSGLVTGQGKSYCGELAFSHLQIAESFERLATPNASLTCYKRLPAILKRQTHAHKGHYGRLLCIGGGPGMPGAIRLSAEAALRAGAGLVKVFAHPSSLALVAQGRPELMLAENGLAHWLNWASVIAIGPGLGQSDWAKQCFAQVVKYVQAQPKPVVIDADGLHLLSSCSQPLTLPELILTPHPGEAAVLLGVSSKQIEADRYAALKQIADKYRATALLKGAGTLIRQQQHCLVCEDGNPGMATAGMGDVLTGIVSSLLAQGLTAMDAAEYAVCIHAAAADRAAESGGQRGMIASDVIQQLREFVNF